jgi:hypothetical protein
MTVCFDVWRRLLTTSAQISHTVGVISVPEITRHSITSSDRFLMWASDGVWEFLSNQEVVDIVGEHFPDLEAAAHAVVNNSMQKWREVCFRSFARARQYAHLCFRCQAEEVVDDITIVILSP